MSKTSTARQQHGLDLTIGYTSCNQSAKFVGIIFDNKLVDYRVPCGKQLLYQVSAGAVRLLCAGIGYSDNYRVYRDESITHK
jgi:hypothetical protein